MKNNYKIYYNDSFILFSSKREQINNNFTKVVEGQQKAERLLRSPDFLYDGVTNERILLVCEYPGQLMCDFLEKTDVIVAGGGLVWNEQGELLMIFRRGKWDLPKGKIELEELIIDGAKREVTEETGVKVETVDNNPIVTYHAYMLKGKRLLKQTVWYSMKAAPGQSQLSPQTEEDISDVKWVSRQALPSYQAGCYPLIWDLISDYALKD
ncbi:MAG: NUDIX domain-containing protein [Bacteroidetes bacterium]|nr:NUDIX domain-containing protein [Bacteroidota bacterium]MBK8657554.1 NUDIX domain-containing protein [Bacteroidota bacterium]